MKFLKPILIAVVFAASTAYAANVLKKTANADGVYEYSRSVNTPEFSTADYCINPDVSALSAVAEKYWKPDGSCIVSEMDAGDKAVVDVVKKPTGENLFVKSLDGSVWIITVSDAGVVGATKQ